MQLNFTKPEILNALTRLGIKMKNTNSDTVDMLCPFHDDKNFGNAMYFMSRGYFKCYSGRCGRASNIIGIVKQVRNVKFQEAYQFVKGVAYSNNTGVSYSHRKSVAQEIKQEVKRSPRNRSVLISYLKLEDFKPEDYRYTSDRGFDDDFIKKHNIKICKTESKYYNYMIIPITDKSTNLSLFEARQVMLHEVYEEILGTKSNNLNKLKNEFRRQRFQKEMWQDWRFKYTLRPKTYYIKGFRINNTIFNQDNLDYSKPVYATEGITGLPKVRRVFGENYTATFGAELTVPQIRILKRFPHIYFIPDGDGASITMIEKASEIFERVSVIPKTKEDTHKDYEQDLKNSAPIEGTRYCIRALGLLN
jgi:DNA primase